MKALRPFYLALILVFFAWSSCEIVDDDPDPTDPVQKFLGTWKVSETCTRMNYTVQISPDPGNTAQVLIYNFGNPGPGYNPAVGLVVSNTIYVQSQTIGEGWTVSGQGTYQSGGSMSWTYALIIGPGQLDCNSVFTR